MNDAFCIQCHGPMQETSDGHLLCRDASCPNSRPDTNKIEKAQAQGSVADGRGWPP